MNRGVTRVAWTVGAIVAGVSVLLGAQDDSWLAAITAQLPGLAFLAAATALAPRMGNRRDPVLLAAIGLFWLMGDLAGQFVLPELRGFAGLVLDVPLFFAAWLVLALPSGRLADRRDRALVWAAAVGACVNSPIQTLVLPPSHDPVHIEAPAVVGDLVNVGVAGFGVVVSVLVAARVVARFARGTPATRRILGPLLLSGGLLGLIEVGDVVANFFGGFDETATGVIWRPADLTADLTVVSVLGWIVLAAGFFASAARSSSDAGAVGRLLPGLSTEASAPNLRDMLAQAVRDPSLTLELDPVSAAVAAPGRACTDITFGEHTLARLDHDEVLLQRPAALEAATAALGLLLGRRLLVENLATAQQESRTDRERLESDLSRVRDAFGAFVDPAVADAAILTGWEVGGHEVEVTLFFLDVRGFTAWAGRAAPSQVMARMNALWELVVPIVTEHGGHANKFIGDGLLAVFGAPTPCPDHAHRAVDAAHEIVAAVQAGFRGDLEVGVGIHTGPVMAGTVGGGGRVEFTVLGDVVNSAARIEAATRVTGDDVLISGTTYSLIGSPSGYSTRPGVALRGKRSAIPLHARVTDLIAPDDHTDIVTSTARV